MEILDLMFDLRQYLSFGLDFDSNDEVIHRLNCDSVLGLKEEALQIYRKVLVDG